MEIIKTYLEGPFPCLNKIINVKNMAYVWWSVNVLLVSAIANFSKISMDCFREVEAD